jgi:energy-coupling factor transporter ATP-binding protein EcfA2
MIRKLVLKNFKIHQRLELDLAEITVLIGQQGVGKSTVLDGLYLLAQSAAQPDLNYRATRMKGLQFQDLVHRREERNIIEFRLNCEFAGPCPPVTDGPSHTLEYWLAVDSAGFREHGADYLFAERQWQFRTPRGGRWTVPPAFQLGDRPRVEFRGSTLVGIPFVFALQGVDYPLHRIFMQLRGELVDYLRDLHLVRTARELVEAVYPVQERMQTPFGSVEDVVNWLAHNWDHRDLVSSWAARILGRRIAVRAAGDQLLVEAADGLGAPHLITNEGSGLRQLLWPLTALAAARQGSLVAVEEPEIHLHPAAQVKLCEVLCEAATEKGKRILLTTHSEHILMGFLTAVAAGRLQRDCLAVYCMGGDGPVRTERLAVDERGMIEGGLKGFFEAGLDELSRYLAALVKDARP